MLPMLIICLAILAISGLTLYAMRAKVKLKISATALKWFSFSIEVESQDGCRGSGVAAER
jgi:hypothetical protein